MRRFDLSTDVAQGKFLEYVGMLRLSGKPAIFVEAPAKRSLDQNALSFALYEQVAKQKTDESIQEIRRYCKLHHGVPILRRDDEKFRAMYDKAMKHHLDYEEKLAAMEFLPVTSLMGKKQFSEYLDEVIRDYSQNGYCLVHPSEVEA